MKFKSLGFTHPGHTRKVNEDSFYMSDLKSLWIVCDGMGGHEEGNFASHLITDIFENLILKGDFENKIELIVNQLKVIHSILENKIEKLGKDIRIGTTLMLLHIDGEKGVCVHSGDSRCYNLRNNILSTVTKDHAIEINDFYGYRRILTSAISAPGEFNIEISRFIVEKDDIFLLCSDGLYEQVDNITIKKAMGEKNFEKGLDLLKETSLSTKADDNITALMVGKNE